MEGQVQVDNPPIDLGLSRGEEKAIRAVVLLVVIFALLFSLAGLAFMALSEFFGLNAGLPGAGSD